MTGNTAIFFDIENLTMYFAKRHKKIPNIQDMYLRINELEGVNGIAIQRAYADWSVPAVRELRQFIMENGIESVQVFNTNYNDLIKNSADVYLIIDAVEILLTKPQIDFFVIVSGDGIFSFLAKKIHEYGKKVIGCGYAPIMNQLLKRSVDDYVELEVPGLQVQQVAVEQPPASTVPLAAVENPPVAVEAKKTEIVVKAKAQPKRRMVKAVDIPKNKISNALNASGIAVLGQNPSQIEIFRKIKEILLGIYQVEGNENSELDVSIFKMYIDHYIPGFRSAQFLYKRFIDFLRYIFTGTPYCVYVYRTSLFRIIKRKTVPTNKKMLDDIEGFSIELEDGRVVQSLMDIPLESGAEDGAVSIEEPVITDVSAIEEPAIVEVAVAELSLTEKSGEAIDGAAAQEETGIVANASDVTIDAALEMAAVSDDASDEVTGHPEESIPVEAAEPIPTGLKAEVPAESDDNITMNPDTKDGINRQVAKTTKTPKTSKKNGRYNKASKSSAKQVDVSTPSVEQGKTSNQPANPDEAVKTTLAADVDNGREIPLRQMVKETVATLIEKKRLTQKELNKLKTAEYGKETFNINYPFLREVNEDLPLRPQRIMDGKARYWRDIYEIRNKKYIIYQDWSEKKNRRMFVAWMERLIKR